MNVARIVGIYMLATLGFYLAFTFSFAGGPTLSPNIEDAAFPYYGSSVGYLSASADGGEVTIRIAAEPAAGTLALRFDEIDELSTARSRELFGATTMDKASEQADARATELARVRKLANMDTLKNGWRVVHENTDFRTAVETYTAWFERSGMDVVADAAGSTSNVKAFTATGEGAAVRIVFHREANGVRVYLGPA